MTRPAITAAAAALVAAAAGVAIASTGHDSKSADNAAPKIYGTAPATPPATTAPAPTTDEAEDITRRWTTAFDRASACVEDQAARRTIVKLAAGELARQLADQPPRPGAQADCNPPKIVRVTSAGPPQEDGLWVVLVEHKGATGGPFTVTLQPTDRGLRVVRIDY